MCRVGKAHYATCSSSINGATAPAAYGPNCTRLHGRHRIRQALRRRELMAVQPRAFVPHTTQSKHGPRVAANHVLNRPAPTAAD
ncbi:hypothetical protein [Hymenobacter cavernae]|uniref:hypothetical protein n=1 Tax=Hymenobacter cavernae TaxID=2044852 RepID=UPI00166AC1F4|nr:hypothetical protein [Hymenobacter cavernae]